MVDVVRKNTVVIGASIAGLASAACLSKIGIDYAVIEKQNCIAFPWRHHYKRLHLHTNKALSNLPYHNFGKNVPKYPSRQEVLEYLEEYQKKFKIIPEFETEAKVIEKQGDEWSIETNGKKYLAKNVIVATGPFGKPRPIDFPGIDSFNGSVIHSSQYQTGEIYKNKDVLVVGFGNSACEIAIDLWEQGARPVLSVRSAVNVLPRDLFGIPVLQIGLLTSIFPPALADVINAPIIKMAVGDIRKLGLKKLPYGPLVQINKYQSVPLLDIGTLKLIKEGNIKVVGDITDIKGNEITFEDNSASQFDAIVAAIGYEKNKLENVIKVGQYRFEDLNKSIGHQAHFGEEGLYFCGFWIAPTGQFREIGLDAIKIAKHIQENN